MVFLWIPSGLGDVLFSWQDAYDFQQQNHIPVAFIWERSEHFGDFQTLKFDNFFKLPTCLLNVVNIPRWDEKYLKNIMGTDIDMVISAYVNEKWDNGLYRNCRAKLNAMTLDDYINNNILIRTTDRGIRFPNTVKTGKLFEAIRPSDRILSRIQEFEKQIGFEKPIGVHIRRTDKRNFVYISPDSLFIDKMNEILSQNPNQRFFLCTDDPDLKCNLREMFHESIISIDARPRYSNGGLDDSVFELFLLSKCSMIYGCKSGFSMLAAKIGNIQHEILSV